jgi:pimeloyl-ACP methyl ester carboxylesterase
MGRLTYIAVRWGRLLRGERPLADGGADTRRALSLQDGPTVLVGHSWSGTLVSETGDDPKVSALVSVAARAPDAGEDFVALSGKFPTMPARAGVEAHDGYTKLNEDAFLKYFANGVPHAQAEVKQDQTISPELERFLAGRMKAKTLEVDAGHLSMVSKPQQIAKLILEAAAMKK